MSESKHPAVQFTGPLKDLAEGRTAPDAWLAWWEANAAKVEAACPRGWFLKLKPQHVNDGATRATLSSQQGACDILAKLNIPFAASGRYLQAWQEDFQRFVAQSKARALAQSERFEPIIAALESFFPKFAHFLRSRAGDIDQLDGPASAEELVAIEKATTAVLPDSFSNFLRCTKGLSLDGLSLGVAEISQHPADVGERPHQGTVICIGEYWLEGDGDQVLLLCGSRPMPDAPVYYYAHGSGDNRARKLAPHFVTWVESLSKSSLFQN